MKPSIKQATKDFSRDTKITIRATQSGGNASRLTALFPSDSGGRDNYVKCTLGDFENCAALLSDFLIYATDTTSGFPSQLRTNGAGGAVLDYHTAANVVAGFPGKPAPGVDQLTALARGRLHSMFEQHLRYSVLADRLLETTDAPETARRVKAEQAKLGENLDRIAAVSDVCYDRPRECKRSVDALVRDAKPIDQSAFELPAPPRASYRIWTSGAGVWSRARSVAEFALCKRNPEPHFATREDEFWYQRTMFDVQPDGETIAVGLYVEGVGLRDAKLFFQDSLLQTIPLVASGTSRSEKLGPGYAYLVLASTRQNPGWRDVDLESSRKAVQKNGINAADGVFYVIVDDIYGRQSRFDIEYQSWMDTVWAQTRNRWWDVSSDGVSVAGSGGWSEDVTANNLVRRFDDCSANPRPMLKRR